MKKRLESLITRVSGLIGLGVILAGLLFPLTRCGISVALAAGPPTYQWHTFFGSSGGNEYGNKVALDSSGNIYIAGSASANWTGPGGEPPKNPYSGASDILVIKLNKTGVYQWHSFFGSVNNDYASSITVDQGGNVYVTGHSRDTGWGAPKNTFSGMRDIVVLKLDTDGAYQWHTFHGSFEWDEGYGIVVDGAGNTYVAGYSNVTWGAPLHAHSPDPGVSRQDIVVLKLDSTGLLQWNTFWGSSTPLGWSDVAEGVDIALGIARDDAGNLYVTGRSYNSWQGGNSNTIDPLHPHSYAGGGSTYLGNIDIMVLKLDNAGAYQWHTFYGGPDEDRPIPSPPDFINYFHRGDYANIPILDDNGNIYVSGYSYYSWQGPGGTNPLHPHSGDYDIMVLKLNSAGVYQWHTFYGSAQGDYGDGPVLDGEGNFYQAASSGASWQGDNNSNPLHPHSGSIDITFLKLNSAGAYQWHTFYGSSAVDYGYGLVLDGARSLIAVGASNASWLGDGNAGPLHAYSGLFDAVVLKLGLQAMLYLPLIVK
jgi:hypothetical protein